MDPNKDFIHIDDVFKNLRNGEERESSGAWMNMKGLLDAEMPVGRVVSGGRSARRYIIPAVALLLLGGGATYWKLSSDKKANAVLTETTQTTASQLNTSDGNNPNAGDHTTALATVPASDAHSGKQAGASGNHSGQARRQAAGRNTQAGPSAATPADRRHANGSNNPATDATHATAGTIAARNTPVTSGSRNPTRPAHETTAAKTGQQPLAASHTTAPAGSSKPVMPANSLTTVAAPNTKTTAPPVPVKQQQIPEATAGNTNSSSTPHTPAATADDGTLAAHSNGDAPWVWKTKAVVNNEKIVQSPDGNYYKEQRDTFKRIDLVERYVYPHGKADRTIAPKLVTDTVAVTRIENIRYVPLTQLDIAALKKLNVNIVVRELVPLAKLRAGTVAREHVNLVPLSDYKVASRRVDPSSFNKLIQNTAGGLAGYFDGSRNFYAAIMFGGNGSFGNPGAFGMQIGIAGLLTLSERWTLVAELKYMNHYFSNYNLQDKSVSYEINKTQNSAGWLFSGNEMVTTSSYKINSYGSIHMPVTMSYNLGRVSVFGGIDLAYAFPLSWNKQSSINVNFVESQLAQDKNPYQNSYPQLDEVHDFGSRFGMGYAMGMSYDFSRKLSVDARVTQILFDNAKGGTEGINKLFRQPSLQLSLGYFFGRKDKVVYIMDKR